MRKKGRATCTAYISNLVLAEGFEPPTPSM